MVQINKAGKFGVEREGGGWQEEVREGRRDASEAAESFSL